MMKGCGSQHRGADRIGRRAKGKQSKNVRARCQFEIEKFLT
jgi:hypothetical protein